MKTALVLLAAFSVALACGCEGSKPSAASPEKAVTPIRTMTVSFEALSEGIEIPAKIQADPASVIHVFPPASGRLLSLQVRPGDKVHLGQTVALLQSSDLASARADFLKAKIEAERSEKSARRASLLREHEVFSEKDYEDARAAAEAAQSELTRARQRLQLLGASEQGNSDQISVKAPRSGVVLETTASPGELSRSLDNANSLLTMADLSSVWVVGDLFEKDIAAAKTGAIVEVLVNAYPGESWKGKIAAISEALDPATRTLKLRIVLPNPNHRLKPEMFASVRLTSRARQVLTLPPEAVTHDGDAAFVFVDHDGKYVRQSVMVGQQRNGKVEVVSGINAGDKVVTTGAELLRAEETAQQTPAEKVSSHKGASQR